MRYPFALAIVIATAALTGCQPPPKAVEPNYQTVAKDVRRDSDGARKLTEQAKARMADGDYTQAEKDLKKALCLDMFFGPAHNNLGICYYKQRNLYLAAWEFEYAVKLLPFRPEPKNNLGLVMESVGKYEDAAGDFQAAMKIAPDNPQFIGNLARCRIRQNQRDDYTRQLLQELLLKDTRPTWVQWAHMELMRIPAGKGPSSLPAQSTSQPDAVSAQDAM